MPNNKFFWTIIGLSLFLSQPVSAQVVISEIMYDLQTGSDTGREWVEIANTSGSPITVSTSTWKFFEANTNHGLTLFQGSLTISAGGFFVIADDPSKFLVDWPNFSGTIFDSTFSLTNTTGEVIAIKTSTTTTADQITYDVSGGAAGDGNSLQLVNGVWKGSTPTPNAVNSSSSGNTATTTGQSSGTTNNNPATDNSLSEDNSTYSNYSSWPTDPQIFCRIVGPSTGINGADIVFRGETSGLDKKPIENARYVWNFGDGATKEGESVLHAYNFPGDYVVILDVSSGKYNATSRLKIKIISADIALGGIVSGSDGKVDLINNSSQELDLSYWRIRSGNQYFNLPKNTKIVAHGKLPLSSSVTGLNIAGQDAVLLYPNGSVAYNPQSASVVIARTEVVASPEKLVAPVFTKSDVQSKPAAQVASVASALEEVENVDASQLSKSTQQNQASSFFSPWLFGVVGVIILGLGFTLLPKPPSLENSAEAFTIIEDK